MQVFVVAISFLTAALGVTAMYNAVYIPPAKLILFSGLVTVVIYFVVKKIQLSKNKKPDKLMSITMTLFGVMFLSSLVYSAWDMEKFISRLTTMKLTLLLLGIIGVYLNVFFIRAEISYKKKRGNPVEALAKLWELKATPPAELSQLLYNTEWFLSQSH